ncbi:DUF1929 domain-containing protein [Planosporangium thailandense]|uniref:DUF1929 domain-containing protein n=1 Tax=Planosporangium thailandense TaxID=765197 RepID=A0ABX0Y2H7_9ACTN|nr:galactose oxidase early set domain-containing protein [Planosporangium thailandense]NJC72538.1 DUF1929 domain-containing protein [Planosporangium thailandense]
MNPLSWLRTRSGRPAVLTAVSAAVVLAINGKAAYADTNQIANPGLENLDARGFPVCWEPSEPGAAGKFFSLTSKAHSGANAMRAVVTAGGDNSAGGDKTAGGDSRGRALMLQDPSCAPKVSPGHQYDVSLWYTSTTPDVALTVFRHDVAKGWQFWGDLASLTPASTFTQKTVRTPPVPPGTDRIRWGAAIYGAGTLVTDDYSTVDVAEPKTQAAPCTAGPACTKGAWQVMPFNSPVRAVHSVVLNNGNVLLIAGSGNDPNQFAAGTFKTALYQPKTGTFISVPTPGDMFCGGHAQLPDGRVLVVSGTKAYPSGNRTYAGTRDAYIFDPKTNRYEKTNTLNAGHWYPGVTTLGNGDVITLGGLDVDSHNTVVADYFSNAQQRWLGPTQIRQDRRFWGLYPAMVLMQDGRLFYTGSHIFDPGTGPVMYNHQSGAVTAVPGLRGADQRQESMSVLLPPAQDQRVLIAGGSNINANTDAIRLTDIVDLKQARPTYTAGPLLPTGTLTGGRPETPNQGKTYLSLVTLPDGKVFETGGDLHTRADPVFEASMFDPATNTFTAGMATDPVPRGYHSSAFLLPDGRVMAVGDNPANNSFDMRVSIYSPPYLFHGPRPQIRSVADTHWEYGSAQRIRVDSPIVKAALIRPAAVTHATDSNQRYVDLPMSVRGNRVTLNVTSNPNIAPPGWYMLFVVNAAGVPSVAQWVHVG